MAAKRTDADWVSQNQHPTKTPESPRDRAEKLKQFTPPGQTRGRGKSAERFPEAGRNLPYRYQRTTHEGTVDVDAPIPTRSGDPFRPTPHGMSRVSDSSEVVHGTPQASIDQEEGLD